MPKSLFSILLIVPLLWSCGTSSGHDHHDENEEENHHEHGGFELAEGQADRFGITHSTVTPAPFRKVIKVGGIIEASPSDFYTVTAKESGIVNLSHETAPGERVTVGQRLGTISAQGVQGGDVNQAARVNLETARAEYERLKPLYEDGLVTTSAFRESERAYNEAKALAKGSGSKGGDNSLVSPVAGSITGVYVKSGDYVEVGAPVATVTKNSNLTLKAELPSRYSRMLTEIETANFRPVGSDTVVSIRELGGKKLNGTATSETVGGYLPVYFTFSGNTISYPAGYVDVYLIAGQRDGVISVPRESLIEMQGRKYIYVVEDGHSYEKRPVKTGESDGENVEILEGLTPGEEYVSKGASIVRMTEVSAVAPPAHTHNH